VGVGRRKTSGKPDYGSGALEAREVPSRSWPASSPPSGARAPFSRARTSGAATGATSKKLRIRTALWRARGARFLPQSLRPLAGRSRPSHRAIRRSRARVARGNRVAFQTPPW